MSVLPTLFQVRRQRDSVNRLIRGAILLDHLLKTRCGSLGPDASPMDYINANADIFSDLGETKGALRTRNACVHEPTTTTYADAAAASRVIIRSVQEVQAGVGRWRGTVTLVKAAAVVALGVLFYRSAAFQSLYPRFRETLAHSPDFQNFSSQLRQTLAPAPARQVLESPLPETPTTAPPLPDDVSAYHEHVAAYEEHVFLRKVRTPETQYVTLKLANRCHELLTVAVWHLNLGAKWVTAGWWDVQPGQIKDTDVYIPRDLGSSTTTVHAVAGSEHFQWNDASPQAPRKAVPNDPQAFVFYDNAVINRPNHVMGFTTNNLPQRREEQGFTVTLDLTCDRDK